MYWHSFKNTPRFLRKQKVDKLEIISYHLWFKHFLSKWIHLAQSKAKERLLKAVELDTIVKYTDRASFSSSAVDAHAFFLQVWEILVRLFIIFIILGNFLLEWCKVARQRRVYKLLCYSCSGTHHCEYIINDLLFRTCVNCPLAILSWCLTR